MAGLPRLRRQWMVVSLVVEASAQTGDGEGAVRVKRGSVGGVGGFTEGGVCFYRVEARWGRAEHLQLPARRSFNGGAEGAGFWD
jgi:hypothetical protein